MLIPKDVDDNEILVRGVLTPFHYSTNKGKLKEEVFLPPRESNEVSILRLQYTNETFCKKHAKTLHISGNHYYGLAIILAKVPKTISVTLKEKYDNGTDVIVQVCYSPLDEHGNLYKKELVFITDTGTPMHADIHYNFTIEKGKNIPAAVRRIARKLATTDCSKFYYDQNPNIEEWDGEKLEI